LYYPIGEDATHIEVKVGDESVWLSRNQIATLFGRDVKTIGKHISNVFSEGELEKGVVVANFATTTQHGAIKGKTQTFALEYYNLDVIISVGYRVKSKRGTQFRIWANQVLKDYLLKGYALNQRMNRIENSVENLSDQVKEIHLQIKTNSLPNQGVFFDGQVFDAYELASKIIRSAEHTIVLIDNYIDETTFTHLSKKKKGVNVLLLTKSVHKSITLDLKKANEQFGNFEMKAFNRSHDHFLIIDQTEVYHVGASLKNLGKKWFAFSKMESGSVENILNEIKDIT